MYNTYVSSNLILLRHEGSLVSSSSLPCCSCCCHCCASSFACRGRELVNGNLVYGLRQTSLIQWSPFRRLIVGGRERYRYRVPAYDFSAECYEVSCSFKPTGSDEGIGRRRKKKVGYGNWRESRCLGSVSDAEAVISLLTEDLSNLERNGKLLKKGEVDKSYRRKKKKDVLDFTDHDLKQQAVKSVVLREKEYGSEEKEASVRGENRRGRNENSSCSSYYSLSSSGDFENDLEDNHEQLIHKSSSELEASTDEREDRFEKQMEQERKSHSNDVKKHTEVLKQENSAGASFSDQDWRKKYEKKLTEVSVEGTHSQSYIEDVSSSRNCIDQEESTSSGNLDKRASAHFGLKHNQMREESKFKDSKYEIGSKNSNIQGSSVERSSQSQQQFKEREESRKMFTDSALISREDYDSKIIRSSSEKELHSNLQRESEFRIKTKEEEEKALFQSSVKHLREKQRQTSERIIGQADSEIKTERYSKRSDIDSTSNSQREAKTKKQEESSSLISLSHEESVDEKYFHRTQLRREEYQDVTKMSVVEGNDRETNLISQQTSAKRMTDKGSSLTSEMKILGETNDKHTQTDETEVQIKLQEEQRTAARVSVLHEKTAEESSNLVKERDQETQRAVLMPPQSQLVARASQLSDPTGRTPMRVPFHVIGSSSVGKDSAGSIPAKPGGSHGKNKKENYGEPLNRSSNKDAMSSVHRLEESGREFVGEFIEKASPGPSTTEIQRANVSVDKEFMHEGQHEMQKMSDQLGSVEYQLKEHVSRESPASSSEKGPSDQMWDVKDTSFQEPQPVKTPKDSKGMVVRRTGRSLWSIISDVVLLRWRSRAETPKSAAKSGQKGSSNESVSSETWFSGRDIDETSDGNVKGERSEIIEEPSSSNQNKNEEFERKRSEGQTREGRVSSPSDMLKSQSPSGAVSLNSEEEASPQNDDESSSSISLGRDSQLLLLPSTSASDSKVVEETLGTLKTNVPVTGSMELMVQPISTKISKVSVSEKKEGELKRRKLQRTTQVLKDRFDDWEEAFILESEQRKTDEMFMREALIEAQKAGDTWEVPVGAVLVRDGKIIARGYNLVEKLRDSTAHAEMICIREASNLLRSWRLTETTLYVTLEPCPMCAGAILQARINTVVWGAPNKLLGADGSWIRLFPGGGEGNGAESSDKPAAPVHPFHPNMKVRRGVLASECADAMQEFFQLRRRKRDDKSDPPSPSSFPILTKMQEIFHIMFCM